MTWSNPTPAANASLAKGAAIAALVYHGLALALFAFFASALSSLLLSFASLPTDNDLGSLPRDLSAALTVMLVLFLIILGSPVALSVWMLVAANRGRPGQVLAALLLYATPFVLFLLTGTVIAVANDQGNSLLSFYTSGLPDAAIIIVGWVGWWQMRRPPAAPAIGQPPYQVQQPIPYTAPAQQYAPPYQGTPQTPQPPPQPGQGSPWGLS
ncbi:MAG: hypothetical protein E7Z97_02595 [Propionibacteriaceae bacterium]|uniref:Uncharacterized protein n=1 Tax=Propionibacterium ruminifibrarum TaxID=1962131 RepID=A0A375I3N2_9ACTN|nr:hypothetical protein [Propionibacterium ruminifibrarum]MBE6476952.1 hypothetical protein [Propionibacteriaceae bacterium]SPF69522.1 hypothetical protein PROPJV5_2508 [Propionibacterium ruminifibrarum]